MVETGGGLDKDRSVRVVYYGGANRAQAWGVMTGYAMLITGGPAGRKLGEVMTGSVSSSERLERKSPLPLGCFRLTGSWGTFLYGRDTGGGTR
jgi:hypothetical protein